MEKKSSYTTLAELTNGIILNTYDKILRINESYQTEAQLESNFIQNLENQGYRYVSITNSKELLLNLKNKLERLNKLQFTDTEWQRFLDEYLNCPNDGIIEKTRKIQQDYIHDFIFDNGYIKNIKIIDKEDWSNNCLQVMNQFSQRGSQKNRYDVTILVNGLPLVQVELKKRGVSLQEAFNQIHRYNKESFNSKYSLFKYVQIFVISNGTYTRYFANTTANNKNHYQFTCEWADAKNQTINDLEDFTKTFFEQRVLLEVLTKYCVLTVDDILLIMRPYQIAATERILWKIKSSHQNNKAGSVQAGGYIWHTTGSGKTLTSFKTARLATELEYVKKVFFIVDRKDLDFQTMKEYQKFQADSVNGSKDTKALKKSIEKQDNKIIVTTIQKLNEFIKNHPYHDIYNQHCVLIFDECHRSQFGEAQKNIKNKFKQYYLFGFTGTPIFAENALKTVTTADVFGTQLHSYVITDAIRDGKVLKFKVDYHNVNPKFKETEQLYDDEALKKMERKMFLHPERIDEIANYILENYNTKTHRTTYYTKNQKQLYGFNAMFAVQSVEAAKLYYEALQQKQANVAQHKQLKIATIYSYTPNEEQRMIGELTDENFEPTALNSTDKEFLVKVISDYNQMFKTNYSIESKSFQDYYKDLSNRVKNKEIDLLIVVGMFLTGFDAPTMNTLFVDKNLRYHGLIQAFSRTNRIFNKIKPFGNIICFRDLEQATKDALKTFGDENSAKVVLEKAYDDYMHGFIDNDKHVIGYLDICQELLEKFPEPTEIYLDTDKKEFVQLFGEYLKSENILKNYDEFYHFDSAITERQLQDMKSVYVDIKEEIVNRNLYNADEEINIDFSDIEFQIELLKTDEINLDYILELILEKSKKDDNMATLKEEIIRTIRSSIDNRAKEALIMKFIDNTNLTIFQETSDILEEFYTFAKQQKQHEIAVIIDSEKLKPEAEMYIDKWLKSGRVIANGIELDSILPPVSRRRGAREAKKQQVLTKLQNLVEVYKDI